MGYEMGSTSEGVLEKDDRDEDDEEDYEETPEGSRLFEFMFGNVSGSGDLDIDYLDEDAKEHLAALADKLGSSLAEIDLSVKSSQRSVDAAEQDYDKKAEDAVDYEDIDEQYEGPEIQAVTEEDYLLPKKDYFSAKISATTSSSVFDDENYDDDYDDEKEFPKENEVGDSTPSVQVPLPGVHGDDLVAVSQGEHSPKDHSGAVDSSEVDSGTLDADFADFQKEELDALEESLEESLEATSSAPLPVLCIEDGVVILRFSEIFAIHEPLKKAEKRDHWYSFPKEKYKAMDISDIVEEDEEEFLKGSAPALSFVKREFVVSDDLFASKVDEPESENLIVNGSATIVQKVDVWRKDSCNSAEPVIEDISVDFPIEWSIPSCPEYFPLDQQDWENRIIFDTSPAPSENSDMFAPESESLASKETDAASQQKIIQSELEMDVDEKDHGLFLHGLPVSVEQFGSGDVPRSLNLLEDSGFHPQLLRLESRWEIDRSNFSDSRKQDTFESDTMRRFNKLSLRNKDVIEGSWTEKIIWEPQQPVSKPKLILDLQDEQMLFEILDDKDVENLHLHAGAMIIARSVKSSGDSFEQHGHGNQAGGRFNIANDKFYSNRKSSQQLKSHSKKRTTHSIKVLHSVPALKLQTMKTKLSNKDIANFHRPKALWFPHDNGVALREQGKLLTRGPMKIILKSLGGKGSKLHVEAEETISSVKAKATKKLDFKPSEPVKIVYSGKELEDHKSLAEQNVRPNSLLHLVRTKIHLLPKAQKLPGENKSLRPPGAFKKKSDLSAKDGHVFLMEYCEERPLLLGNVGMGVRLCTYYQKLNPGDQNAALLRSGPTGLGNVLTLDPADKSPFLGDIKAGSSQSCLESNMYRAPIYTHKVASTDYLLIRSAKGKLSIRRIDRLDVVGQQEPHMEVMSPASKGVQMYNMNRLLVYMYREFRTFQKRGVVPSIRASELSAQFPYVPEVSLRKRLKHFCDFQRGSWVMRPNFRIPLEEELRRMVTPEHVCAYESMLAGQYRLKRLGISMTHPAGLSSAMNQLPDEAITLAAASHIERELQITPWNLSSNFVACTNQDRGNIERLEITGVGDPSGRGLGFSYVRSTPKAPVPNAMAKKKVPVNRGGSTVTGTDADLRRLSMEAAREVLLKFNVPDEQITKLTRWHRIAMIRKLSSEQASSGLKVDPTTISKYARGQRMSFLQLQQQTREKCQEIWDRQVQNLSAADGEEIDSDTEPNSDLDSFAGDLENLLDAEEGEEGEDGNDECNYDNVIGVKGLKMRRLPSQAQAEEEIEDEAAEAAELCKMLMDDDMADRKKKKKAKSVGEEMKSAHVPQLVHSLKNKEWTKTSTVSKPVTVIPQQDVAYSSKEIVKQSKEEEIFASKKHFSGKLKPKKKENVESIGLLNKKIKILGDGIKSVQVIKEKKSARESFVCGACGQLGHMRTNKHCPRYREDVDVQVESRDAEKVPGKSIPTDLIAKPQQKATVKKLIPKVGPKIAAVEIPEDEKSGPKAKVLKVKCGSSDLHQEKVTPANSQLSDRLVTSDTETVNISSVKVNKIIFSKKTKPEDVQVESYKPSIVIRPPAETNISQPRKKIIIKQPKEVHELDQVIQDGYTGIEFTKTRRINELSGFPNRREQDREHYEDKVRVRERTGKRSWEEEQKRRFAPRHREERANMLYEEHSRNLEEGNVDAIRKYQESLKMEREEEKRQREKKKKTKNKPFEMRGEFFDDFHPRRNDRRILERERTTKRKHVVELSGRYGAEYAPPVKRRRGGEVALANILEKIVDTLKDNPVSYLFLKPVSKKEAPDYLDIIERPMDLSKIKDNVRKFQYKCREDFRHDVWQITYNAHKYNDGKNPGIPPLGDQLLELCDFLLSEYHENLSEAEDDIEDD